MSGHTNKNEFIKPCPWCGPGDDMVFPIINASCDHVVTCSECLAEGPGCETEAEAIARWNTRHEDES